MRSVIGMLSLWGCLAAMLAPQTSWARGERLDTGAGVLTLGGRASFNVDHVNPDRGDSASGLFIEFSPMFGGFVVPNLLLYGDLSVTTGVGDLYDEAPTNFGMHAGVRYLFNFWGIVVPYVGGELGPDVLFPDRGDNLTYLSLAIPAGILIALNPAVAVDVGTKFTLKAGLSGPAGTEIHMPIGYLGVSAFF